MASNLTIRGLSRTPLDIGGQRLTTSTTIEVDLEDSKVRKNLITYKGLWTPDVQTQLDAGGSGTVAFASTSSTAFLNVDDVWATFNALEITVPDHPVKRRRVELFIPVWNAEANPASQWLYGLEVNGNVTRFVYRRGSSERESVHLVGILPPNMGIDAVVKPAFRVTDWVGAAGQVIVGGFGGGVDEAHLMASTI